MCRYVACLLYRIPASSLLVTARPQSLSRCDQARGLSDNSTSVIALLLEGADTWQMRMLFTPNGTSPAQS